jgi:hypothetical protein
MVCSQDAFVTNEDVDFYKKVSDVMYELVRRGYKTETAELFDTVKDALLDNSKYARSDSTDDLSNMVEENCIPGKVFYVEIRYEDESEPKNMLIAEEPDYEQLRWGFTDDDIFFYGMSMDEVKEAIKEKRLCEGEWYITDYHGIAEPIEFARKGRCLV